MLPQLFLEYHNNECSNDDERHKARLQVSLSNYNIKSSQYESDDCKCFIFGHPIMGDKISAKNALEAMESNISYKFIEKLNGEYLVIHLNKRKQQLSIINDRFSSIPFFYWHNKDIFIGSVFYNDLWIWLKKHEYLKISEASFFEFMWLQRLVGTKTYDEESYCMKSSTWMTYTDGKVSQYKYWKPCFDKTTDSMDQCATKLSHLLKQSVSRKTSDEHGGRYGIFLSGGLDSRTILGCFESPPTCFTLAVGKNNEYNVAKEIAETMGSRHVHIPLSTDPYSSHLDALVKLGGGMHVFDHALFYGFREIVNEFADVVFHGHGFDYMFQGIYIPTKSRKLFGKDMQLKRLRCLENDLVADYLNMISYRLKKIELLQYIKADRRQEMYDRLYASVNAVIREGEEYSCNPYDIWEYLLIHNISRHYPYTNLLSMGTCAEQRTVTFDNDVFDLYLSLPAKYRIDAKIARKTLKIISPKLASIRNANTNMGVTWPAWRKLIAILTDVALVNIGARIKRIYAPQAEDRTWPHRTRMIQSQFGLRSIALELCNSAQLDSLEIFDMDKIRQDVPAFIDNPPNDMTGDFLTYLITIDRFLKQ